MVSNLVYYLDSQLSSEWPLQQAVKRALHHVHEQRDVSSFSTSVAVWKHLQTQAIAVGMGEKWRQKNIAAAQCDPVINGKPGALSVLYQLQPEFLHLGSHTVDVCVS